MNSKPLIEQREPDKDVIVPNPTAGVIYLMPSASGIDGRPSYMGADALLAKQAVTAGVAVEYALPEEKREFVEYFSEQIDIIGLYIAVANLVPSMIQGIQALLEMAAIRRGYTGEGARKAKVDLRIDYLKTPTTEARGIRVKGDADSVVEVVNLLSSES